MEKKLVEDAITKLINEKYLFELATEEAFSNIRKELSELLNTSISNIKIKYFDKLTISVLREDDVISVEF